MFTQSIAALPDGINGVGVIQKNPDSNHLVFGANKIGNNEIEAIE
jgi:hypothetical protein